MEWNGRTRSLGKRNLKGLVFTPKLTAIVAKSGQICIYIGMPFLPNHEFARPTSSRMHRMPKLILYLEDGYILAATINDSSEFTKRVSGYAVIDCLKAYYKICVNCCF